MNPTLSPDQVTMESNHDDATAFTSTTNWHVSGGSLASTLTFESSISPIDEEQAIANYANSSPLMLYPPSSDSSPCEITLSFIQKHEIRQVYVRSTARVYELYHAPQQCSTSEYLCTVRCGIADKDEDVVHLNHLEEVASSQLKGSLSNPADRSLKGGSNLNTAEDEWIEVKALDSPQLDDRNVSLPSETDIKKERIPHDFFEATAEINDADPCTSLTLRLLSVQSKDYVCIDELYVFADPVDPADSESQVCPLENSTGASLVAMFMPSFMQLSKTRSISGVNEQNMFSAREKHTVPEVGRVATDSANDATKMQQNANSIVSDLSNIATSIHQDGKCCATDQEVKSHVASAAAVGPAQLHCLPQVPNTQNQPDFPLNNHIYMALDQLVSRVGKIEELCLKFEENMLKPISGIEKRLQRVEEQLEVLTKRTEDSRSCTRFSAPEFSCNDSNSNFINSGSYSNCGNCESGEKAILSELSPGPDDLSSSVNDVQLVSGLVVTAPEFCSVDDEEESNTSEPVTYPEICNVDYEEENHASELCIVSQKDILKQTLSIDDAMSSALIGFLSSTSGQTGKYIQTLAVKAPEFSSENGSDISADKKASCVQSEIARDSLGYFCESDGVNCVKVVAVSPICFNEIEGATCAKDSGLCSSNISENEGSANASQNNVCYMEVVDGVNIQCQHNEDGECNYRDSLSENGIEHDIGKTEIGCIKIENAIAGNAISSDLVPLDTDVSNQNLQNQEDGSSKTNHDDEAALYLTNLTVNEELAEGSDRDILQSVIEFSHASSIVDFETPILDVKFISQENFATRSPLEALLADMPGSDSVTYFVEEVEDDSPTGGQSSLIVMEDGEVYGNAPDNHFFVDMNYFRSGDVPSSIGEDETRVEKYTSGVADPEGSLI